MPSFVSYASWLQIFDNIRSSIANITSRVNMASAVLEKPSTSTASTSSDADALDLLQRLQQAIFNGQPQMAANVASELAKMRADCSMSIRRSEIQLVDVDLTKDPIRVPVEATTTISDLETQIYLKHKVPIRGRCVMLLETPLSSQENLNGAGIASAGSSGDGVESSTNDVEMTNGATMENEIGHAEWACAACTFINEPADTQCLMCETNRVPAPNADDNSTEPEDNSWPNSSMEEDFLDDSFSNYQELLSMEQTDLITNLEAFECPICEDVYYPGEGVILKTCLHHFCRECLKKVIESSSEAEIKCPYTMDYTCDQLLQDREIRALLTPESYARYLQLCMSQAESKMANAFHCKTPKCSGWCEFEYDDDVFTCPVCSRNNCLACRAIHDGMNCAQYRKKIQAEGANASASNAPASNAPASIASALIGLASNASASIASASIALASKASASNAPASKASASNATASKASASNAPASNVFASSAPASHASTSNAPADPVEEHYLKVMKTQQFDTYDMVVEDGTNGMMFNIAYHYEARLKADAGKNLPNLMKRLVQEATSLSTALPLSFKSSVFVRCDTDRLVVMKALITGPADTPYANGCFEFDLYFPPNYPNQPMLINFQTTGRHTIRFNPNLYNDGKVCLSLLNTWRGKPEEQWNPKVSTCLQALVSIQSLILVPDPYFNEPGYEHSRNSNHGKKQSREYNVDVMKATVRWAMLEQLRNPTPCFRDIILSHFWLKRNEITNQITQWIKEIDAVSKRHHISTSGSLPMKRDFKLLCDEFAKLTPPPGCKELSTLPQFMYKPPTFPPSIASAKEPSPCKPSTVGAYTNMASMMNVHMSAMPMNAAHLNAPYVNAANLNVADIHAPYLDAPTMNAAHLNAAHLNAPYMNAAHMNTAHVNAAPMFGPSTSGASTSSFFPFSY